MSNVRHRWQFYLIIGLLIGLVLGIPAAQLFGRLGALLPGNGNLVKNGSFEHLDGWDYVVRPGSSAAFNQDDTQQEDGLYSLNINVMLAAPTHAWYIQVLQSNIPLQAGHALELSFYAKGDAGTTVEPLLQQAIDPFAIYFDRTAHLTAAWQKYSFTLKPSVSDPQANLVFNLAGAPGQIWMDNVALAATSSSASANAVQIPTPAPTATATPLPIQAPAGWTLVWHDEFDGSTVDATKWNVVDSAPGGYHNDNLGDGLQAWTPQAVSVQGGMLRFTSSQQNVDGHSYASGALTTQGKYSFLYGRVDIRARVPKGDGLWPAIWTLPVRVNSASVATFETDILELLGQDPTTAYIAEHSLGYPRSYCTYTGPDFSASFHIYSIEWSPGKIVWLVDGAQHCLITVGVPNEPMYLLMNTYVGGSWPGPPDRTSVFPQYTDFDYVRIYARSSQ
ncbi:MAG TPA: family 16 glycosylhydrolase [Ktedonobacterales bacterium]|nr:family 16 glycosylhydrolase [Ktedonobacterales bacterium]